MKYHNTTSGKRKTQKRGGTKETNTKTKKVVKTEKQPQIRHLNTARNQAIIERIQLFNTEYTGTRQIAFKFGLRAFNHKENKLIPIEQIDIANKKESNYLHDDDFYNIYTNHKKDAAAKRRNLRNLQLGNSIPGSPKKSIPGSPKKSIPSTPKKFNFEGDEIRVPFSDRKVTSSAEKRMAGEDGDFMIYSPTNSPTELFKNDFSDILPPLSPSYTIKTPDYSGHDDIEGMFDSPKKKSPNK
tara:strand:+ start:5877 stop:6599 length:723 start_codon:yes stop_codon:yes gene_type:complete